jgi:HK97 gp10 family phage protein
MLSSLPNAVNEKIQNDFNTKAAYMVKAELERNAPDGDNDKKSKNKIANNVVVKNEKGTKSDKLVGFTKRAWYVKLLEFGTAVRAVKGKNGKYKGANRGSMPRKPFVLNTHNSIAPQVIDYLKTNYVKMIGNSIKKQSKAINRKLAKEQK